MQNDSPSRSSHSSGWNRGEGRATQLLHEGIAAAKAGDRLQARRFLHEVTRLAPTSELGWLWLAGVADGPEEAIYLLQKVLELNPGNERARAGLAWYQARRHETPVESWRCPFCQTFRRNHADPCPGCGALLVRASLTTYRQLVGVHTQIIEQAVERLHRSLKVQPGYHSSFHLGLAYLNLGRVFEAIRSFRQALDYQNDEELLAWVNELERAQAPPPPVLRPTWIPETGPEDLSATVLVVDDSPTIRQLVARLLERNGFEVLAAANGMEAIDLIDRTGVPSLILLDVSMPEMDGFELCELLRRGELTKHVAIVMLTGKNRSEHRARGQAVGATEYLTKPFPPDRLLEVVQRYCPRTSAPRGSPEGGRLFNPSRRSRTDC
jgi:CheY-like chemotaxis protein